MAGSVLRGTRSGKRPTHILALLPTGNEPQSHISPTHGRFDREGRGKRHFSSNTRHPGVGCRRAMSSFIIIAAWTKKDFAAQNRIKRKKLLRRALDKHLDSDEHDGLLRSHAGEIGGGPRRRPCKRP